MRVWTLPAEGDSGDTSPCQPLISIAMQTVSVYTVLSRIDTVESALPSGRTPVPQAGGAMAKVWAAGAPQEWLSLGRKDSESPASLFQLQLNSGLEDIPQTGHLVPRCTGYPRDRQL